MRIDQVHINLGDASPLIVSALLAAIAPRSGPDSVQKQPTAAAPMLTPPDIGEYWTGQGGVYVGIARGFGDRRDAHLVLAISPHSKFEDRELGTDGVDVKGATSDSNGRGNTIALAQAGSDLCKEILEVEVDGHKDFGLMSRQEARLCIANVPEQFEQEWHLTSTQSSSSNAWRQNFDDGGQIRTFKKFEGRARLVRRVFF